MHADVESCSPKKTPPGDLITFPQMLILTFSIKGVLSTSINMYAIEKNSLLSQQFSFLCDVGIKDITS